MRKISERRKLLSMKRFAFKMKLKEGCKEEYMRRHDAIWAEMNELLTSRGIRDYSIFLERESNTPIAVQTLEADRSAIDLGDCPIVQNRWKYMSDIMETNPDFP